MSDDIGVTELLRKVRESMGPELIEVLLKARLSLPEKWLEWPLERRFEYLRCRLKFTQDELAEKSGLAQSQVSRMEGGADALLSSWRRIFAAMGFELVLLPVSRFTLEELETRAEEGRPAGHWLRQRARPRRRWMRGKEARGAEVLETKHQNITTENIKQ